MINARCKLAWLGSIVCLALITVPSATAKSRKCVWARVRFLATSTITRNSFGENHDVYLIEIDGQDESGATLARLEDIYPPYRNALPETILKSSRWGRLKIIRDQSCDVAFGAMPLRTAPGDPIAILPKRLGFHPHMAKAPDPNDVLPCYRTARL